VDPRAVLEPTLRSPPAWDPAATVAGGGADETIAGAPETAAEPLEARFIGHFAVLRKLGEGGMGVVYAAYDERLERRVALKLIHGDDPVRLMREAQALARVSHPNVVQIYEVGAYADRVFVAMEYVEGPSLAEWLAEPRDIGAVLEVFVQAGRGLEAAHARGLVHRDFKPGNVIVGADGRARVLDFGLARADDRREEAVPADISAARTTDANLLSSPLTRTGSLLGTPAYMSPEQFLGVPVDARSDQFSFCVALYEALYDRRPFAGATMPELMAAVTHGEVELPPPRPELAETIPAAVLRGLVAEPDRRWPTMTELVDVLDAARGQVDERSRAQAGGSIAWIITIAGLAMFLAVNVLWDPGDVTPASMTRFAVMIALVAVAALPTLRARYREPQQRVYVNFGVAMPAMSMVARFFSWRAGLSMSDMAVTESLCFVTAYMTMAVFLRAPLVLINIPVLLGALVLVHELGAPGQILALSWLLSIPVTAAAWWYTALRPRRRGATSQTSMSAGPVMPSINTLTR
jgi:serine/threonine-protein kinase